LRFAPLLGNRREADQSAVAAPTEPATAANCKAKPDLFD
jgi:hypothetical protein